MTTRAIRAFCRKHGYEPDRLADRSWAPVYVGTGRPVRGERGLPTKREAWEWCETLAEAWAEHKANHDDTPALDDVMQRER